MSRIELAQRICRRLEQYFRRIFLFVSKKDEMALVLFVLGAFSISLFQNCTKQQFVPVAANIANSSGQFTSQSESLTANDLVFGTNINVPLVISAADILEANTAPSGQTLVLVNVGVPSLGQLTQSNDQYSFVSSAIGESHFTYTLSDSSGENASGTITVKILDSSSPTGSFYACDGINKIFVIDPLLGKIKSSINITYNGVSVGFNDLAIDSVTGVFFGKGWNNNIYKVNLKTGVSTLLIPNVTHSSMVAAGLTFLPDGRLVTAKPNSSLVYSVIAVNLNTLAETTIVPFSAGYKMAGGDIKALPDGFLYWTVTDSTSSLCRHYHGAGDQAIVRIDPSSGAITEISCLTVPHIFGLGFAQKSLYGFSGLGALIQVDLSTGIVKTKGMTGAEFVGATANPLLW